MSNMITGELLELFSTSCMLQFGIAGKGEAALGNSGFCRKLDVIVRPKSQVKERPCILSMLNRSQESMTDFRDTG